LSAPSLQFLLCYQVSVPPLGSQLYEYHFIKYEKTWKAAQEYCTKNHSDLATVSNETDMQRLQRHPQYRSGAWIGLQRDWRWSQPRVKFNESKWSTGQPNNEDIPENCVWMKMKNDKWEDDSCNKRHNFICYDGENMWCIESVFH
uniref:C-type lectin domain-containing protein n=1 Tax=Sander lucioperca TaxID=283035 RepID=A0A8C9ZS19_SANLU